MSTSLRFRDSILDLLLGTTSQEVLNPLKPDKAPPPSQTLIQDLIGVMQQFKAAAFHTNDSKVDYQKLRNSEAYKTYTNILIPQLHHFDLSQFENETEARSFWINLYNALVIHAVIAYEIKHSVIEKNALAILGFFHRASYKIGDHTFRLDDIEQGILRNNAGVPYVPGPQFSTTDPRQAFVLPLDPRIHFALNCASNSCPRVGIYTAAHLDQQLDIASRNFLQHEISLDKTALCLSKIFLWYRNDFGNKSQLIDFLQKYTPVEFWGSNAFKDLDIKYHRYNWQLNT